MGLFDWIKKQIQPDDNISIQVNNQVIKGNFVSGNISKGDQIIQINGKTITSNLGKDCIQGNGIVIEKDFSHIANGANSVILDSVLNIHVSVSPQNPVKMTIKGEENILEVLNVKNKSGELSIHTEQSFNTQKSIEIFISLPSLSMIKNSGVGNITGYIETEDLKIKANSTGNVDLECHVQNMTIKCDGVGGIKIKGQGDSLDIKQSGVGNVKLTQFDTPRAIVEVSGVGSCDVSCSEYFGGEVSGIGNITVYGTPDTFKKEVSGLGKIKQKAPIFTKEQSKADTLEKSEISEKPKKIKYEL